MLTKEKIKITCISLLVLVLLASLVGCSRENKPNTEEGTGIESKSQNEKISYETFLNISLGGTYEDITKPLGEGEMTSSSESVGIVTQMYSWTINQTNITITVQDNVVISKAQTGLFKPEVQVTLESDEKIIEGMTYDEIKAILGEGELSAEIKIMEAESKIYSYVNKDLPTATFTFSNGKLMSKSQLNLK